MMTEDGRPHRAVRLDIKIEADTRQAMINTLDDIGRLIATEQITDGVSGGYDSGYIYKYTENDRPTHAEYADQLKEYLSKVKL